MCKMIISPGAFFSVIILIFQDVRVLKEQKMAKRSPKWEKTKSVAFSISWTVHHMILTFGAHVQNDDTSSKFFHFSKFWFLGFLEGKGQKWPEITWLNLFCSIILGTVYQIVKILIMIYAGVLRYFVFKNATLEILIYLFFIGLFQQFYLIIICFWSSSLNAKKKFWGVSHMCVIF